MPTQQPRFRLRELSLRLALIVFIVREIWVLTVMSRIPMRHPIAWFLMHPRATPASVLYAFLTAIVAALIGEFLSLLVLRPLVRFWLSPRVDTSAGLFRLAASEWMLEETPARRLLGPWSWEAGTIVRTNQRVWFIPAAWDAEPWAYRPDELITRPERSPTSAFGLIGGFPDRIVAATKHGDTTSFAVSDPEAVLPWFRPGYVARVAEPTPDAA